MSIPATVIGSIVNGEYDDSLRRIAEAVRSREKEIGRRQAEVNRLTLEPGARVRLKGLSPKALNGREGAIVENKSRHKTAIAVQLDHPYGGIPISYVPAQCVESI